MERLTKRIDSVVCYVGTHKQHCEDIPAEVSTAGVREVLDRLAEYEDRGIDPHEVKLVQETLVTAQRLKKEQYDTLEKYLKAEAEGRLVILPCKAGSKVFVLLFGSVVPASVIGFHFYEWRGGFSVRVLFDARKTNGTGDLSFEAFGKTVFLTREEAEAALKGEKNVNM